MGILNGYLNIKNKIKLNDAIVEGIAKAISEKAEKEVKNFIEDNNAEKLLRAEKTTQTAIDTEYNDAEELAEVTNSGLKINQNSQLSSNKTRDFDSVFNLMEEIQKLEKDQEYLETKKLVITFFEENLTEGKVNIAKNQLEVRAEQ